MTPREAEDLHFWSQYDPNFAKLCEANNVAPADLQRDLIQIGPTDV